MRAERSSHTFSMFSGQPAALLQFPFKTPQKKDVHYVQPSQPKLKTSRQISKAREREREREERGREREREGERERVNK